MDNLSPRALPLIGLGWAKRSGKDTVASILVRDYGFSRYAFADQLKEALLAIDPYVDGTMSVSTLGGIERAARHRIAGGEVARLRQEIATIVLPDYLGIDEADPRLVDAIIVGLDPRLDGTRTLAEVVESLGLERAKDSRRYGAEIRVLMQRFGTEAIRKNIGENAWTDAVMRLIAQDRAAGAVTPVVFPDVRFPNEAAFTHAHGGIVVEVRRPGFGGGTDGHVSEAGLPESLVDDVLHNDRTIADLEARIAELMSTHFAGYTAAVA